MNKKLNLFLIILISAFFVSACAIKSWEETKTTTPPKQEKPKTSKKSGYVPKGPQGTWPQGPPWGELSNRLLKSGFTESQVKSFFNSPDLRFSEAPMKLKLNELYGIFYQSELTREIQEKLYRLGYDILIDGRKGSGTSAFIRVFQKDYLLAQNATVSKNTLAQINKALNKPKKELRPLSSYQAPPAKKPSRTATHTQFTTASALGQINQHYRNNLTLFKAVGEKYDVPGEVVASILWIETGFGNYFGKNKAASMLASMAASKDYNIIKPYVGNLATDNESVAWLKETASVRGDWAYNELVALLQYAYANKLDPNKFPGSIYGAIGYGQFMPSNIVKFGADGDNDNIIDLFNINDAVHSTAYYLKQHGWQGSMNDEQKRRDVIMKYNKSGVYVNTVLYVADYLKRNN